MNDFYKGFYSGLGYLLLVVLTFLFLQNLFEKRDDKLHKSVEIYEKCIMDQYNGMTVMQVYYLEGKYPVCGSNK